VVVMAKSLPAQAQEVEAARDVENFNDARANGAGRRRGL